MYYTNFLSYFYTTSLTNLSTGKKVVMVTYVCDLVRIITFRVFDFIAHTTRNNYAKMDVLYYTFSPTVSRKNDKCQI